MNLRARQRRELADRVPIPCRSARAEFSFDQRSGELRAADPVRIDKNMGVKIWAVVVGVGKYTAMPSLQFTDDDAFRAAEELGINISTRFESSSIDEI